jgi:Holliday junction resolvase RusA-like endonuclease
MVRVVFRVAGKPPKKIRGKSLWTADSQASLVRELRKAAYIERENLKIEPLKNEVLLQIEVQLPTLNNNPMRQELFWGDLDNIVSGICESLQKANTRYKFISDDSANGKPILYDDDSQIVSINAIKTVSDSEPASYRVIIEETCARFSVS